MTLGEKQRKFTRMIADLIIFAYDNGYELTFSEAYRTPEQAQLNAKSGAGIKNSLHTQRLAVDFNLFKDGKYLQHQVIINCLANTGNLSAVRGAVDSMTAITTR